MQQIQYQIVCFTFPLYCIPSSGTWIRSEIQIRIFSESWPYQRWKFSPDMFLSIAQLTRPTISRLERFPCSLEEEPGEKGPAYPRLHIEDFYNVAHMHNSQSASVLWKNVYFGTLGVARRGGPGVLESCF